MECARAFGACISMKEEPHGEEIPEQFEPNDYHLEKINEAKSRLESLKSMDADTAAKIAFDEYEREIQSRKDRIEKRIALRNKYEAMLAKVSAWVPPSSDHTRMKEFM